MRVISDDRTMSEISEKASSIFSTAKSHLNFPPFLFRQYLADNSHPLNLIVMLQVRVWFSTCAMCHQSNDQHHDGIQYDMNRNIAKLAEQPRGLRGRSRLIPYDADIKRMRRTGASFKTIANWICGHGLSISGSAVHAYVQVRVRLGYHGYQLLAMQCLDTATHGSSYEHLSDFGESGVDDTNNVFASLRNEYVYKAPRHEGGLPADADLSFNNPLD